MPLLSTRGAASARGFGFGASTGFGPVPDASINIANSVFLGAVNLTALGITGTSGSILGGDNPYVMSVSDNGLYVFLNDYGSGTIYRFNMATPYNITTLSATVTDSVFVGVTGMMGGSWNTTGSKFATRQWSSGPVYTWNTANWSLSGFSGTSFGGPTDSSYSFLIDNAGQYAYTNSSSNGNPIRQFDNTGSWSTWPGSAAASFNTGRTGNIYGTFPSGGRSRLFQICDDSNLIQQVDMPSAGALSAASNGTTFDFSFVPQAQNRRNTTGVMMSDNRYWYMLGQRGGSTDRYITWWRTGT